MNKLKLFSRKAYILAAALVSAFFETLALFIMVGVVAAFALVVLPIMSWVGTAAIAKAKLGMVRS